MSQRNQVDMSGVGIYANVKDRPSWLETPLRDGRVSQFKRAMKLYPHHFRRIVRR